MLYDANHFPSLTTKVKGRMDHARIDCACGAVFTARMSRPHQAKRAVERSFKWHYDFELKVREFDEMAERSGIRRTGLRTFPPSPEPTTKADDTTQAPKSPQDGVQGGVDLVAISARYGSARMAGTSAEDGGKGWDESKINALKRSWQDVYYLMQEVKRLQALIPKPVTQEELLRRNTYVVQLDPELVDAYQAAYGLGKPLVAFAEAEMEKNIAEADTRAVFGEQASTTTDEVHVASVQVGGIVYGPNGQPLPPFDFEG